MTPTPIKRHSPTSDPCPRCPTDRPGWLTQKTLTHPRANILYIECNSPRCDYVDVLAASTPDTGNLTSLRRKYTRVVRWLAVATFSTLFTGYWLIVSLLYRFR